MPAAAPIIGAAVSGIIAGASGVTVLGLTGFALGAAFFGVNAALSTGNREELAPHRI